MQEVKRPKKPLIYFYAAMILAILVFNCLVVPYLAGKATKVAAFVYQDKGGYFCAFRAKIRHFLEKSGLRAASRLFGGLIFPFSGQKTTYSSVPYGSGFLRIRVRFLPYGSKNAACRRTKKITV